MLSHCKQGLQLKMTLQQQQQQQRQQRWVQATPLLSSKRAATKPPYLEWSFSCTGGLQRCVAAVRTAPTVMLVLPASVSMCLQACEQFKPAGST
jgi:hypothetical protein